MNAKKLKRRIKIKATALIIIFMSYAHAGTCQSWLIPNILPDTLERNIKSEEYHKAQSHLGKGWNTWYSNHSMSHVLLPEKASISLSFASKNNRNIVDYIHSPQKGEKDGIKYGIRSIDGSYTSLTYKWNNGIYKIESATYDNDNIILVSPIQNSEDYLIVDIGLLWEQDGEIGKNGEELFAKIQNKKISVYATQPAVARPYIESRSPRIAFQLKEKIGICTGKKRTKEEIVSIINNAKKHVLDEANKYGNLSEQYLAMQSVIGWNTIYDAPNKRVITPTSREWNEEQGGWVLYAWDTFFASMMSGIYNKNLAYANAVEMAKNITEKGFIPGRISVNRGVTYDRSQPPVGSMATWNLYCKYGDKWFLEEIYDELLSWNRWWIKNRSNKGFLSWGYDGADTTQTNWYHNAKFLAVCESGLDNTHMYDDTPFNLEKGLLDIADVGLISLYISDCEYLEKIAETLNRKKDASEIRKRKNHYSKIMQKMWNEEKGIFLNIRLDKNEYSKRISPTNLYPLLTNSCSDKQIKRMIDEFYFNPHIFYGKYVIPSAPRNDKAYKDNNYWRGRIWGPMNFLVYMGMRKHKSAERARIDLANKSRALFLHNWKKDNSIFENYNAETGEGADVKNANSFYHWGALLILIDFFENGYFENKNN